MNRQYLIWTAVAVLIALGAGFGIGRRTTPGHATANAPVTSRETRHPLYYRNPMGLPDTSPVPKKDAMGMDYIPVFAEDGSAAAPGGVVLSPERVQMLGVRSEVVRRQQLADGIRAGGTIGVDETRQFVIAPRFDGWVASLQANQIGLKVRRGQALLTVYSPQLLAAQEDYRVADAALRSLQPGDPASAEAMRRLRDAAKARLLNWGIGAAQLQHLAHGQSGSFAITAPADGVLVDKSIVQGSRFNAGETILRLADLSTVWVTVNVPASQTDNLRLGQPAAFSTPALPGQGFTGKVDFLQPALDPTTRTLAVRVALPNPDGRLRPGLYGAVVLTEPTRPEVLTIPRSALIDSGTRQLVLVQVAEGRFAPRTVTVGRRTEAGVEVQRGLIEGERVVVDGNFLIDSESNLRAAMAELAPTTPAVASGAARPVLATDASPATPAHAPPHADHGEATPPEASGHAMDAHDMSRMEH